MRRDCPRCSRPVPGESWWSGRSPRLQTRGPRPNNSGRRLQQRADPATQLRVRLVRLARHAPDEDPGPRSPASAAAADAVHRRGPAEPARERCAAAASWRRSRDAAAGRPPRPRRPSAARRFPGWARCAATHRHRRRRWCTSSACRRARRNWAVTNVARTDSRSASQAGLFVRLTDRRLLGCLVTVSRPARQAPGAALMAPHRSMLQQHRRGTVGPRGSQQQSRRAVPTPVVGAAVGDHPSVTVALHEIRICR